MEITAHYELVRAMTLLNQAGITYGMDLREGAPSYLWLPLTGNPDDASSWVVLRAQGPLITLRVEDVIVGPFTENQLWLFNEINQDWPTGCVFYNRHRQSFGLRSELHVSDETTADLLKHGMSQMLEGVAAIRDESWPQPSLPAADRPVLEEAASLLRELGMHVMASAGGKYLECFIDPAPEGERFVAQFYCTEDQALHVRCHFSPEYRVQCALENIFEVHQLNNRLPVGKVALAREHGIVCHLQSVVPAWVELDTQLLAALIDHAVHGTDGIFEAFFVSTP